LVDLADPRLESGRVKKKQRKKKLDVTWLTRQNPVKNPVDLGRLGQLFLKK